MPIHPAHVPTGYRYLLHRQHKDTAISGRTRSGASGLLVMGEHTGTHIDALSHMALDHKLNGGIKVTPQVETPYGFTKNGVENLRPIVGRGLLLDVPRIMKVRVLPPHYGIAEEDLRRCCEAEGIKIKRGDVLLVRTGYAKYWNHPGRYASAAGVSLAATRWLVSKGVSVVGADNMAWELDTGAPDPEMGVTLPCHVYLIVQNGICILGNLNLDGLASERKHEFLFVCLPLKLVGATGSPVRPIAITGLAA